MKTKSQLLLDLESSFKDADQFIETMNLNGGMFVEARVKLLENRVMDLYWFVKQLVDALPDDLSEPDK